VRPGKVQGRPHPAAVEEVAGVGREPGYRELGRRGSEARLHRHIGRTPGGARNAHAQESKDVLLVLDEWGDRDAADPFLGAVVVVAAPSMSGGEASAVGDGRLPGHHALPTAA